MAENLIDGGFKMRTAKEIIEKSEFNKSCIAIYSMNHRKRGYKTFLKNCLGSYDASIIISMSTQELAELYKN